MRFARVLRFISNVVHRIVNQSGRTQERSDHSEQQTAIAPPPARTEVDFVPAVKDRYETYQRKSAGHEWWKIRIEAATLIGVIVYAAITWCLFRSTEEALKETKRSNELTHRAYVMVPRVDLIRDVRRGKEEWGTRVAIENNGQTPATITAWGIVAATIGPPNDPSQCPRYAVNRSIGIILGSRAQHGLYSGFPPEPTPKLPTLDEVIAMALSQRKEKRMPLTLYTIIEYDDIFVKNTRRHTRACHTMLPYVDGSNVDRYIFRDILPTRGAFGDCNYCNSWD